MMCHSLSAQVYNPYDLVVVKSKEEVDPQFFYVLTQTGDACGCRSWIISLCGSQQGS
jgi:hypothetical protein